MMYIPDEWIIDEANTEKVHEIIEVLNNDIVLDGENPREEAIEKLKSIGETDIIKNLDKIPFGA